MKIECPNCHQNYEIEKEQSECEFECSCCGQRFTGNGHIVYEKENESPRQKKSGCSPVLIFGAVFFILLIILVVVFRKSDPPKESVTYKYGLSESMLQGEAHAKTRELIKKGLRYPDDAEIPWSSDRAYEFDHNGKYGVNLSGFVVAKNAFGVRQKLKYYATWHYDPTAKTWECKSFTMD